MAGVTVTKTMNNKDESMYKIIGQQVSSQDKIGYIRIGETSFLLSIRPQHTTSTADTTITMVVQTDKIPDREVKNLQIEGADGLSKASELDVFTT